ncbi:TetR family transcriptional regulator [Kribbella amoyensis]|uniref:TetR family transcriptional regulator n=1 Tax=Kribbella amoyensis TaxID=996641 RepID=A0A561BJQ1_9ACTN|nr:TetR/AcrR family transcriptional regulator [Kribbella amoyensis]TWD79104.1 TetR family transcriptional regulator [Kribbella amoyensis]
MPGGRPRSFDPDTALDRALELFWQQGYEGTSLAELTATMGINKPSLYAVFGNKEQLFAKVLDRYFASPGAFAVDALDEPTIRGVVERLVFGTIELVAGKDTPRGCLTVKSVHACGPDARPVRDDAVRRREIGEAALRRRLEKAPDLPQGTNAATLAQLVHTLTDGIAVQAAAGRTREQLRAVADLALRGLLND